MTYHAAEVYALGASAAETARLRRQSEELLARVSLRPGQAAIDLGCAPSGILDLLTAAVAPGGRVVGLDADAAHVEAARRHAETCALPGVEVMTGDARDTGLPADGFDLVHARTLLVTIPAPEEVVAELARLARPGGWVAGQEPDVEHSLCYPPLPGWDRLRELLRLAFVRSGADPDVGRRLPELFRAAGLEQVQATVHAASYPAGHSRRTLIPDLVHSLRPTILELGLASEPELAELDSTVRLHLADPHTLMLPHLIVAAWGRKRAE